MGGFFNCQRNMSIILNLKTSNKDTEFRFMKKYSKDVRSSFWPISVFLKSRFSCSDVVGSDSERIVMLKESCCSE